jgi:hypothetical protein
VHRIMGDLQWSRVLQLERVAVWRRLQYHMKPESWSDEVAYASHQLALHQIRSGVEIVDPVMRAIHAVLVKWNDPAGLQCDLPAGRLMSTKVKNAMLEKLIAADTITLVQEECTYDVPIDDPQWVAGVEGDALMVADEWKERGYTAKYLVFALSKGRLDKILSDSRNKRYHYKLIPPHQRSFGPCLGVAWGEKS